MFRSIEYSLLDYCKSTNTLNIRMWICTTEQFPENWDRLYTLMCPAQSSEEREHLIVILLKNLMIIIKVLIFSQNWGPFCELDIMSIAKETCISTMYFLLNYPLDIRWNLLSHVIYIVFIKRVLNGTIFLKLNHNANSISFKQSALASLQYFPLDKLNRGKDIEQIPIVKYWFSITFSLFT